VSGYIAARSAAYTESSVLTASPEQLVVMLYDGAIRFVRQAAAGLGDGRRDVARERLRRAEAIIDELNDSLDMSQGELPERLRSIYLFCRRHLRESLLADDPQGFETVAGLLAELRESWANLANAATAAAS
jgi:flagellar protein FliS